MAGLTVKDVEKRADIVRRRVGVVVDSVEQVWPLRPAQVREVRGTLKRKWDLVWYEGVELRDNQGVGLMRCAEDPSFG